eukprot:Nk52_evm7s305 gene=Nk52_evmTU7s305
MSTSTVSIETLSHSVVFIFYFFVGTCVFLMQIGFTLLETGFTREKNKSNILLKNVGDLTVGVIGFSIMGYALAFTKGNAIFGTKHFALTDMTDKELGSFFFQAAFAGTSATIISGCIIERAKFQHYLILCAFLGALSYPLVAHSIWNDEGFLRKVGNYGPLDFAGSGVIHLCSGLIGLLASVLLEPRLREHLPENSEFVDDSGSEWDECEFTEDPVEEEEAIDSGTQRLSSHNLQKLEVIVSSNDPANSEEPQEFDNHIIEEQKQIIVENVEEGGDQLSKGSDSAPSGRTGRTGYSGLSGARSENEKQEGAHVDVQALKGKRISSKLSFEGTERSSRRKYSSDNGTDVEFAEQEKRHNANFFRKIAKVKGENVDIKSRLQAYIEVKYPHVERTPGKLGTRLNEIYFGEEGSMILGTLFLFLAWFGFNIGFLDILANPEAVGRTLVFTLLSGVSGCFVSILYSYYLTHTHQFIPECIVNGILGGLVASSGGCAYADPHWGYLVGALGGFVANVFPGFLLRWGIDDPVNVVGVHFGSGLVGVLMTGLIAKENYVKQVHFIPDSRSVDYGLFEGGGIKLFGLQLLFVLFLIAFVALFVFPFIYFLIRMHMRVDRVTEILGLDIVEHTRVSRSRKKGLEKKENTNEVLAVTAFVEIQKASLQKESKVDVTSKLSKTDRLITKAIHTSQQRFIICITGDRGSGCSTQCKMLSFITGFPIISYETEMLDVTLKANRMQEFQRLQEILRVSEPPPSIAVKMIGNGIKKVMGGGSESIVSRISAMGLGSQPDNQNYRFPELRRENVKPIIIDGFPTSEEGFELFMKTIGAIDVIIVLDNVHYSAKNPKGKCRKPWTSSRPKLWETMNSAEYGCSVHSIDCVDRGALAQRMQSQSQSDSLCTSMSKGCTDGLNAEEVGKKVWAVLSKSAHPSEKRLAEGTGQGQGQLAPWDA